MTSGTGKSHLLIVLGTAAAEAGFRVRYTLATKLVNELVEAADEKMLAKTIARYGRVDLLIIDLLGYVKLDNVVPNCWSRSPPSGKRRTASRSLRTKLSGWTKTFTDPRLCAAIVDRLSFGGNIIETRTDSYRLAHIQNRQAVAS